MTGISTLVTVGVRDIQGEGFPDQFSGLADSVFLDLPQPLASHSFSLKHVETRWNSVFLLTVHRTSATIMSFACNMHLRMYEIREWKMDHSKVNDGNSTACPPRKRRPPSSEAWGTMQVLRQSWLGHLLKLEGIPDI
ncbi:hypothetical protein GOBAR_AA26430 [Gossypium barbadense]|uniref:tRNA (adenine(58)-N(1))-methyltransferase catalytic subunit TRM61 C-terminal domain-containing protein n=1 Tax=Gossypium barbadense TaxID=3634 RepID=A0A2P5WT22_GOSBA|nr:hypothetical protein GOBAR_AA26430 [Gossypium barbadense]